jgi:hypothetical protein
MGTGWHGKLWVSLAGLISHPARVPGVGRRYFWGDEGGVTRMGLAMEEGGKKDGDGGSDGKEYLT